VKEEMEKMIGKALVLGASGAFGSEMARTLAAAGWQVTRYQRGSDMTHAAMGMDVIVNGLNPPNYHNWKQLVPQITDQVLAAARASGATVLVPGNVYVYGKQPCPWGVDTPHRPVSRKGQIRAEMEARYRAATRNGVQVIILRGGDFLLPDSAANVMARVVLPAVKKGVVTALGAPEIRRAYAFLPDMALAGAALLARRSALAPFSDIAFPGHCFSLDELTNEIARQTGRAMRVRRFPWGVFRLMAPVWELAREMLEMRYLYDLPHSLTDQEILYHLPEFQATPFDEIVQRHLVAAGMVSAPLTAMTTAL